VTSGDLARPAALAAAGDRRRERLAAATLYLCMDARERQGDLASFLDAVLSSGVDIVQLRQKGLEAGSELRYLDLFRAACSRHGALLAVNDRADIAFASGADVLHLGQDDLPPATAREIIGPGPLIGLSTHSSGQAGAAAQDRVADYFCAGPVWPTPTKPGRPAPGLPLIRKVAGLKSQRPWFAIGGIDESTLPLVLDAGARRVVVVRALTEAADPAAATRRLAAQLAAAGSAG
jgi:thiamine-phosphate pyrophosphorylase